MAPTATTYVEKIPRQRGRCTSCLCMSWKVFACIFSHVMLISLVVAYCLFGSYAFERLESENEKNVKMGIKYIRGNLSLDLWHFTQEKVDYLKEDEWTGNATKKLVDFENKLLEAMNTHGWDGIEDPNRLQWTRMGALFYSIIVITTIGYGHIAPKTDAGKISTIFYAIIGIPLMLLCLSNIGDIMASSFRFIYWRVCCFVCTREPKRRMRRADLQRSLYQSQAIRLPNRASMRRSIRMPHNSNDITIDIPYAPRLSHAYSDTELRYANDDIGTTTKRHSYNTNRNQRFSRYRHRDRLRQERHTIESERVPQRYHGTSMDRSHRNRQCSQRAHSLARFENHNNDSKRRPDASVRSYTMTLPASHGRHRSRHNEMRAQSVDPRIYKSKNEPPVLCNKYAIDALMQSESECQPPNASHRSRSMPRSTNRSKHLLTASREPSPERQRHSVHSEQRSRYLAPPTIEYNTTNECVELEVPVRKVKRRKGSQLPPSPRIMSPLGLAVYRQARLQQFDDDSIIIDDDWLDHTSDIPVRPVPIWLCVFLVIGYIIGGAFYFSSTESWSFLDSAYFAFITLTTIGFGDFVPAQGFNQTALEQTRSFELHNFNSTFHVTDQELRIAGCSLYLLFGISLLAMSFNLVQEEVIANVKNVARQLGILKDDNNDY